MSLELNKKQSFKLEFRSRCFKFSISVFKIYEILRKQRINWVLLDQLIRSATSIGANIIEGGSSTSKKEFINYFNIALKSAVETLYWLELLKELNSDYVKEIDELINECTELRKLISTIILNTKNNSRF